LAAQGGSTIIAARDTGEARTPMALWNDSRAYPYLERLIAAHPPRYWQSFSLSEMPGFGLARLLELRETALHWLDPARYIYAGAGEYAFFHLTGAWCQDAGNALQIGCYDARRKRLIDKPLKELGIPLSFFAALRQGHATRPLSARAAARFGLPAGIPVAGPYIDHEAGYASAAYVSAKPLQCSLGTAWVGNFPLPDDTTGHSPYQLVLPAPVGEGRLIIQPLLTGNVTWEWALATLLDADGGAALARAEAIFAAALLPRPGLTFLPWLHRPHPFADALGAGCFVGLHTSTDRAEMLRAVAAGMSFELARIFHAVKARGEIDAVVLSGGASKGSYFRALLAALFAPLPIHRIVEEDWMGARGSLHAFGTPASRSAVRPVATAAAADAIRDGYARYEATFARVYGHVRAGKAFGF
ncbi:MAG TPA: FGGY-family carbohydrate kinase, partial [Armatimonadota bacterium]|nr:FGGY-family carbohydrate kinase [Armatimonadota bacterium]